MEALRAEGEAVDVSDQRVSKAAAGGSAGMRGMRDLGWGAAGLAERLAGGVARGVWAICGRVK